MNRYAFVGKLICVFMLSSHAVAADTIGLVSLDIVPKVVAISSRDATGRPRRFADSRAREFAVKYDAEDRVQSVEATLKPHISDIISIGYAADGKLLGVRFRTGYSVFFDKQPNGTQVVRDSNGGALSRVGRTVTPLPEVPAEQSAKLADAVTDFETLMSALGQPIL